MTDPAAIAEALDGLVHAETQVGDRGVDLTVDQVYDHDRRRLERWSGDPVSGRPHRHERYRGVGGDGPGMEPEPGPRGGD